MSARDIFAVLGGKRIADGSYLVHCPCASHGKGRGDKSPSLSVKDGDITLLVKCYGKCETPDVLRELASRGLLDDERKFKPRLVSAPTVRRTETDPRAEQFWNQCSPAGFTPVESYLRRRCIDAPIPPCIRFSREKYQGQWMPIMVAALQDSSARVVATQKTYLAWNGEKANVEIPRRTECAMLSAAVRLSRVTKNTRVLGLAEGVETAMSASEAWDGLPVWAVCGAGRMDKIEIPPQITELHIYADNDPSGIAAAESAKAAYSGLQVIVRAPPPGVKDWNDFQALKRLKAAIA